MRTAVYSRAELEALLALGSEDFPRSRTFRLLLGRTGAVIALGAYAGLLFARPPLAFSMARFLLPTTLMPAARLLRALR